MLLNKATMLSLIGAAFAGDPTTVQPEVRVKYFSDTNCTDYKNFSNPGPCDPLPSGVKSMQIANCTNANCEWVALFTSNLGGCILQYMSVLGPLQCPCIDPAQLTYDGPSVSPTYCVNLSSNPPLNSAPKYLGIQPYNQRTYLFQTSLNSKMGLMHPPRATSWWSTLMLPSRLLERSPRMDALISFSVTTQLKAAGRRPPLHWIYWQYIFLIFVHTWNSNRGWYFFSLIGFFTAPCPGDLYSLTFSSLMPLFILMIHRGCLFSQP